MWRTASSNRSLAAGPARRGSPRRERAATGRRPARSQRCTWSAASTLRAWSPAEIAALAANSAVRRLVPRSVQGVVDGPAAIGQLHRSTELAVMRHDVGQVVGAARLQIGVAVSSASSVAAAMWLPSELEMTGRRFDPSREQKCALARSWAGAASPAASSAVRIRWAPLLSPSTTHAHPNPLTMPSASSGSCATHQASAASMFARSVRAKDRCSAWWPLRTPAVETRQPPRTTRRVRPGRDRPARRRSGLRERTPGCCRGAGSDDRRPAGGRGALPRRRSPANGSPAGRPRRSPRPPARRGLRGRTPRRATVRRRQRWPAPTGRAGRRGTAGRSSIGWST